MINLILDIIEVLFRRKDESPKIGIFVKKYTY
jgi:hypothetical protein